MIYAAFDPEGSSYYEFDDVTTYFRQYGKIIQNRDGSRFLPICNAYTRFHLDQYFVFLNPARLPQ